jgi:hypothetical protein
VVVLFTTQTVSYNLALSLFNEMQFWLVKKNKPKL